MPFERDAIGARLRGRSIDAVDCPRLDRAGSHDWLAHSIRREDTARKSLSIKELFALCSNPEVEAQDHAGP